MRTLGAVAEVTHTIHPGVFDGMVNCLVARYLLPRTSTFSLVEYPFEEKTGLPALWSFYDRGRLVRRDEGCLLRIPRPLSYLKDFLCTIHHFGTQRKKYDFYVGVDSLNAAAGLVLRTMGIMKRVCFYSVDYSPNRFSNSLLNMLYKVLETGVTRSADFVWCCSAQIRGIRLLQGGQPERCAVVTPGLLPDTEGLPEDHKLVRLVYIGRLTYGKGIELAVNAMPAIRRKLKDCEFWIIGDGPQRRELESFAHSLGMQGAVKFLGFLPDYGDLVRVLRQCDVGVACYDTRFDYEPYSFPGKVVQYLANGLPVIMTRIKPYSDDLLRAEAGIAIGYNSDDFADAAIRLLLSPEFYRSTSLKARTLAQAYDVDKALTRAFESAYSKP